MPYFLGKYGLLGCGNKGQNEGASCPKQEFYIIFFNTETRMQHFKLKFWSTIL